MTERGGLLVADTSTVINLNATGCADRIITALSCRFVVVDVIPGELAGGRRRGRTDADMLQQLLTDKLVELVTLDDDGNQYFEQLVIGPAAMTLDDGEAATIAYAAVNKSTAILDEKKAIRICSQRFPDLSVRTTVDILACPAVKDAFDAAGLAEAVYNALRNGRMRVMPQQVEWIINTIGVERAALCTSLPHTARSRSRAPSVNS
jgi:hypothetical protein